MPCSARAHTAVSFRRPLISLCGGPGRYDKHGVSLSGRGDGFPFGFGLSYGLFAYSDLKVVGRTISLVVKRQANDGT